METSIIYYILYILYDIYKVILFQFWASIPYFLYLVLSPLHTFTIGFSIFHEIYVKLLFLSISMIFYLSVI